MLFTDETKINRVSSDDKPYVRRPKSKDIDPRYTRPTLKHGGGSIMIWGAMHWRGVGPIHKIEGRMDRVQYCNILQNVMLPYTDENLPVIWKLQQDNGPKHTATFTKKWIAENLVSSIDWPSCSPDLNPIENLWQILKRKVSFKKAGNLGVLYEESKLAWESIPPSVCATLIESMPRRLQAVVSNCSYATKY